ncbi:MAG: GHKL domain-containing protein, partial [Sutterella sp.]|nr:GHKL domain-containing protein [Sutterella sp.]
LNAISFYVFGLKRLVSKPGAEIAPAMKKQILELLGSINEEFSRAYGIVEKVCEYVKSKRKEGTRQDLVSIVRQAVSSFEKTSVSGRRHEIRIEAPQSPIWVTAKAMELELVVVNLLRNSLQAQTDPEKKVEVTITVRENGNRAELCVEDNGPVLSDESMRRLSETVLQSEKPEGLGLGLSIVRMLVEEHNGTVRFERADPTGLRVVISLPEENA